MWALKERDLRTLDSSYEIHKTTAGYSLLDHRRNEDILEELKVDPLE
jgi:hypothetical protein